MGGWFMEVFAGGPHLPVLVAGGGVFDDGKGREKGAARLGWWFPVLWVAVFVRVAADGVGWWPDGEGRTGLVRHCGSVATAGKERKRKGWCRLGIFRRSGSSIDFGYGIRVFPVTFHRFSGENPPFSCKTTFSGTERG
ncbi:hypothetical protein FXO38_09053 [Capsicum annuum]|nr:hypothetical protein FXO37_25343 [Capsicum annuum]KAF3666475.1 hypothetical protein FXO38_09053 [Capsicum annuum]